MIVVKVGGSLYNSPELRHWLSALTKYSTQQAVVIVPGGGPFADQVRSAQQKHHFNDEVAHHMAILAMKQFGLLLLSLAPESQAISTYETPLAPISVWLPDDALLSEPALQKSWDISSDSIALWLSSQLQAEQLLLIKHITSVTTSISELSASNILDNGFSQLFSLCSVDVKIISHQAYDDLSDHLLNQTSQIHLP